VKLDKLDALLAQSFTSPMDTALFAEMLSLQNDGRYPALDLTAQQRRHKTLEALTAQVQTLSRTKPVLMIFEDVHWSDPTSLEALGRTLDRLKTLQVLLIVTYRPEFEPPWIGRPYVTALTLNRLGEREIAALIERVACKKSLPESIRQDIIERTDGIPLFVEEMTRAVVEAESDADAQRTAAAVPSSAPAVPASLHASLMARLDRLGPAKEVAQIGSVIGREFSYDLLARVVGKPKPDFQLALDDLVAAGLLFRHGLPPDAAYLFKHALLRDAAYSTLLRGRRQELHRRIVCVLRQDFPDLVVTQPELLAQHCSEGGMIFDAVDYYLLASQRATAALNTLEASAHLRRGRALVDQLPSSEPRKVQLLQRFVMGGWWFS
jgi:predicted ATPase